MNPDLATAQPQMFSAMLYLLAALGLSGIAGLRAYLPLLAVGIASDIPGASGTPLLPVQPDFSVLSNPLVLVALGALVLVEFAADKIPGVDHVNDVIHTIIRPAAGAVILAGTSNALSDANQVVAGVVGATLALGVHGVKAGTRGAVSATTVGTANPLVSLVEDVVVGIGVALLVLAPLIGFVLVLLLILGVWRLLRGLFRRLVGRRAPRAPRPRATLTPAPTAPLAAHVPAPPPPSLPAPALVPVTPADPYATTTPNLPTVPPAAGGSPVYPPIWPRTGPSTQPYPHSAPTLPGTGTDANDGGDF